MFLYYKEVLALSVAIRNVINDILCLLPLKQHGLFKSYKTEWLKRVEDFEE